MYRVSDSIDWCELDRLSGDIGKPLVYRVARCQHGKTRREHCHYCEVGYVDDVHTFAYGIGEVAKWDGQPCIAVSDDGEDVAYLPARYQHWITKREPIAQLRQVCHGIRPLTDLPRIMQRLKARAYQHKLSEILRTPLRIQADNPWDAARAQLRFCQANGDTSIVPSCRSLSDGSAVLTYLTPDGPLYARYMRDTMPSCCRVTKSQGGIKCPVCQNPIYQEGK